MSRIITGQKIESSKVLRAKQLRRQMTPAEQILWQAFRANRLQGRHLRRQQVIDGFIVDFYCHAARLVIEVDGDVHKHNPIYDEERDKVLQGRGLRVLRFKNSDVMQNLEGVLDQIAAACLSPPSLGEGVGERS